MNDLQAIDNYIEKTRSFINPKLFRDIEARGLYNIINLLPHNIDEAKAIARARLAAIGQYFEDEEISQIASTIRRLETLRDKLAKMRMTECNDVLEVVNEMAVLSIEIKNYYKNNQTSLV